MILINKTANLWTIYGGDIVFPSMEDAQVLRGLLVMLHPVDELSIKLADFVVTATGLFCEGILLRAKIADTGSK